MEPENWNFDDYLHAANDGWLSQRPERRGQYFFNLLAAFRPDLTKSVCGGVLDPFYDDSRVPDFLRHVEDNW